MSLFHHRSKHLAEMGMPPSELERPLIARAEPMLCRAIERCSHEE